MSSQEHFHYLDLEHESHCGTMQLALGIFGYLLVAPYHLLRSSQAKKVSWVSLKINKLSFESTLIFISIWV
jgi:hypothetical protein